MEDFVKRMIEEHSQLVVRINALDSYIYSKQSDVDNKVEFANKCIQLSAMRTYEEALRARLENQNVVYSNGEYLNVVAKINSPEEEDILDLDNDRKGKADE